MGAAIPVAFLICAYIGAAVAVITAITYVTITLIIVAVIAVLATAAATYFYAVGDIKNSMIFSGIAIAAGVGSVYIAYLETVGTASALMAEGTAQSVAAAEAMSSTTVMQLATYAQTVYAGWQEFATALHLKLLFQIHEIAYMTSQDYRHAMEPVFNQVSKVSESMGLGALALNLFYQNVRTTVLDVSTSMGASYDVAEIKWMMTYNELLKDFAKQGEHYARHPSDLFWQIAQLTEKPGYDAKGATARGMLQGIDSALTLIKTTVEGADRIRKDLTKLVADLPAVIRNQLMPEINRLNKWTDDFIRLSYNPAMKMMESAFDKVGADLKKKREDISKINSRLKRPGRYIQEIDSLPPEERAEDESALTTIMQRGMITEMMDLEDAVKEKEPEIFEP